MLRAYRVADQFIAGAYPGSMDELTAREKLGSLLRLGISVFINLMEEDEQHWRGLPIRSYEDLLSAETPDREARPVMIRFSIQDMSTPTAALMAEILDTIDHHIEAGAHVYLHCLGGVGRTGTVVGCWLARHGRANGEEALQEINRLREYDPMLDLPSPQTEAQRAMVRSWRTGQ